MISHHEHTDHVGRLRGEGGDDPVSLPNFNTAILKKGSSGQHPLQGCPALLWMVRTQESEPRPSASPGGPRISNTEQGTLLDLSCPQTTQTPKVDVPCETVRNNTIQRILEDADKSSNIKVALCDSKEGLAPRVKSCSRGCGTTRPGAQGEEPFPTLW